MAYDPKVLDNNATGVVEKRLLLEGERVGLVRAEGVGSYTDVEMWHGRNTYPRFLHTVAVSAAAGLPPFHIGKRTPPPKKREGKRRLVFDCWVVNCLSRHAPVTEMQSAGSFASTQLAAGQKLFFASVHIEACFYQCGVDDDLSTFVALDAISGDQASWLGSLMARDGGAAGAR